MSTRASVSHRWWPERIRSQDVLLILAGSIPESQDPDAYSVGLWPEVHGHQPETLVETSQRGTPLYRAELALGEWLY